MNEIYQSVDFERLYLLKEGEHEIYVNSSQTLQQHQIDGLRFLFKQFQKKNPGVIINFPPVCGKSVTVVLFLKAVRELLRYPVLILCNDEEEMDHWKDKFTKWTDYYGENIAVESSNPYIKEKKVFLKKLESLNSYLRRRWSVVVVKEDVATKEMLKTRFEADFKIWITSTDVKKDLSMLSSVYTWLHPNSKFNINNFIAKSPKEIFQKSILLDAFIEDIVIRENSVMEPFKVVQQTESVIEVNEVNERKRSKISLKNKDATGTKIKRSKRILSDDTAIKSSNGNENVLTRHKENDFVISNNENTDDIVDHELYNDRDVIKDRNSTKTDVENFIRDQKPLRPDDNIDLDYISRLYHKEDSLKEFHGSMLNNKNINDNIIEEQPSTKSSIYNGFEVDINELKNENKASDNQSKLEGNNNIENLHNGDVTPDISNEVKSEIIYINEVGPDEDDKIHPTATDLKTNEVDVKPDISNEVKSELIYSSEVKSKVVYSNEVKPDKDVETNPTAMDLKKNDVKSDINNEVKSEIFCSEVKHDIDFKVSEMEENVFKKFKGSILDSIF